MPRRVLIMGAAGRDFHNFNVAYRDDQRYDVVAFTATQIPFINDRTYPAELAGSRYPNGIRIHDESELTELIKELKVQDVVFSYSDVSHEYVMHKGSEALAAGANFLLLGPNETMLQAEVPVVSVCAVRTGSGKSQTTRAIADTLKASGKRVVAVRHPMPYGDLAAQRVQRYADLSDLDAYDTTMLQAEVPVVSVCAVRTGSGKSQTTRAIADTLKASGKRVVAVRHPMPYGDLAAQRVQRYADLSDLDAYDTTIEEREEYEPHIATGTIIYAGVDYGDILAQAQEECDVLIWDGGNNDLPFYRPTVHIVVADPLRAGHETTYHPGEANIRMADVIVINKMDSASILQVNALLDTIHQVNPGASIVKANSRVTVDDPAAIAGKRVLVVEDGPTLTHGEMKFGAGVVAARAYGAAEIVDPRPWAIGTIDAAFRKYNVGAVLPAMGYSEGQLAEMAQIIDAADADIVVIGTPIDLRRVIEISKPAVRVRYDLEVLPDSPSLVEVLAPVLK